MLLANAAETRGTPTPTPRRARITPTDGPRARSRRARHPAPAPLLAALGALLVSITGVVPVRAEIGGPGECVSTVLRGLEVNQSDGVQFIRVSRGLAQGFIAPDTLVHSVSVWLPANRRLLTIPLHLFIIRADADGRPLPDLPIADGGALETGEEDATQTARFTFTFDPPAILPEPGRYALVLMPDRCNVIPLLTDGGDDYPDGELWELSQRQCGGRRFSVSGRLSASDLTFRVEFCDGGTATTGRTWGELKTRYR